MKEGNPSGIKNRSLKKIESAKRLDTIKKVDTFKKVALSILNKQKKSKNTPVEILSGENLVIFQEVKGTVKRIVKKVEENMKHERVEQSKKDREIKNAERLKEKKQREFEKSLKKRRREEREEESKDSSWRLTQNFETNLSRNNETLSGKSFDSEYDYYLYRKKAKKSKHHCKKHSNGLHCKKKKKKRELENAMLQAQTYKATEEVMYNNLEVGETVEVSTDNGGYYNTSVCSNYYEPPVEPPRVVQEQKEQKKSEFEFMDDYLKFMTRECQLDTDRNSTPELVTRIIPQEKPSRPVTIVLPQPRKPRKEVKPQAVLMKSAQKLLKSLPNHSRRPDTSSITNKNWTPSVLRTSGVKTNLHNHEKTSSDILTSASLRTDTLTTKCQTVSSINGTPKESFPLLKRLVGDNSSFTQNKLFTQGFSSFNPQNSQQQLQQSHLSVNNGSHTINSKLIRPPVLQLTSSSSLNTTNTLSTSNVSNSAKTSLKNWMLFSIKPEASVRLPSARIVNATVGGVNTVQSSSSGFTAGNKSEGGSRNIYVQKTVLPSASLLISNIKKINSGGMGTTNLGAHEISMNSLSSVGQTVTTGCVPNLNSQGAYLLHPQKNHHNSTRKEPTFSVITHSNFQRHSLSFPNGSGSDRN